MSKEIIETRDMSKVEKHKIFRWLSYRTSDSGWCQFVCLMRGFKSILFTERTIPSIRMLFHLFKATKTYTIAAQTVWNFYNPILTLKVMSPCV